MYMLNIESAIALKPSSIISVITAHAIFIFFSDCTIISVTLSHNGTTPPVIGDKTTYAFDCSVEVADCDTDELTVTFSPSGALVSGGTVFNINVPEDGDYLATLTLATPIEVSHGQLFTCTAAVSGSSLPDAMKSEPFNVTRESTTIHALVHALHRHFMLLHE